MHLGLDEFSLNALTLLDPRVRSSSFSTAACGLPWIPKSIFSSVSSSATGLPVEPCQVSFRVILGGGREERETF